MAAMFAFPVLAEAIVVPIGKLAPATIADASLTDAEYAVIEPTGDGVRVRCASVDEQLEHEQAHGLGHLTYSLEEFLAELDQGA